MSPRSLQFVSAWTTLSDAGLRARARSAAESHSLDELTELTLVRTTLFGRSGSYVSQHTLKTYRQALRPALRAIDAMGEDLLRPSRNFAPLVLRAIEAEGYAPKTVSLCWVALKALYAGLRWSGATTANPFDGVAPPRVPPVEPQIYSAEEIRAMMQCAGAYARVAILLGADAGLRISEALALTWEQVDLLEERLRVVCGKGRKTASVAITPELQQALAELHQLEADQTVFILHGVTQMTLGYRLRAVAAKAGVTWKGYHAFRHACGRAIYRATGDIGAVADHLRHEQLSTARLYAGRCPRLSAVVRRGLNGRAGEAIVPMEIQQ